MSKHTPGPWRLRRNAQECPDDMIVMNEEGASICDCAPGNPDISIAEAKANARLCAAAPKLLAALKDARERMMGGSPAIRALIEKTDAALAEAEDRT